MGLLNGQKYVFQDNFINIQKTLCAGQFEVLTCHNLEYPERRVSTQEFSWSGWPVGQGLPTLLMGKGSAHCGQCYSLGRSLWKGQEKAVSKEAGSKGAFSLRSWQWMCCDNIRVGVSALTSPKWHMTIVSQTSPLSPTTHIAFSQAILLLWQKRNQNTFCSNCYHQTAIKSRLCPWLETKASPFCWKILSL